MIGKLKRNKMYEEMLGLEELEVCDRREINGKVYFYVSSRNEAGVCPVCAEIVDDIKECKQYTVRDLPAHGKITYLVITKKRFCCKDCNITFTEVIDSMSYGEMYTNRYMEHVYRLCKKGTVKDVSELESLGYNVVRRIFYIYAKREVEKANDEGHEVLCIDETSLKKRHRQFVLVIYSPVSGKVVDILEDRSKERLKDWLKAYKYKDMIKIVSIDMWEQYKDAVLEVLPQVVVDVDRFHVMKNLNECLSKARREIQKDMEKETKEELKGSRWILSKNEEDLKKEEKERLKKNIRDKC